MLYLIICVLAIENMADMLSSLDLLEPARVWFETKFPKLWRLARCKYCQAFWLTGIVLLLPIPIFMLTWFAIHRAAIGISEFFDRFLNAPITIDLLKKD